MSGRKSENVRKADPLKTPKVWEKARREKWKVLFEELAQLLPDYDPALPKPRVKVLTGAIGFIKDLQNQFYNTIQGGFDNVCKEKIEKLKCRVQSLLQRIDQLTDLLKMAKIDIPPIFAYPSVKAPRNPLSSAPSWVHRRDLKWSNKIDVSKVITTKRKKTLNKKSSSTNQAKGKKNKKEDGKKFVDSNSPSQAKENTPVDFNLQDKFKNVSTSINLEKLSTLTSSIKTVSVSKKSSPSKSVNGILPQCTVQATQLQVPSVSSRNNADQTIQTYPNISNISIKQLPPSSVSLERVASLPSTITSQTPVNSKVADLSPIVTQVMSKDSPKILLPQNNIVQSNTFILTNEGNLVPCYQAQSVITPFIINRPPVLVLQKPPVLPTQILNQTPPIVNIQKPIVVEKTNISHGKVLPLIRAKPPPAKKRILRDSTVTTFVNKVPILAMSKQSYSNKKLNSVSKGKSGKRKAEDNANASKDKPHVLTTSGKKQKTLDESSNHFKPIEGAIESVCEKHVSVSPTAAFLSNFPIVSSKHDEEEDKSDEQQLRKSNCKGTQTNKPVEAQNKPHENSLLKIDLIQVSTTDKDQTHKNTVAKESVEKFEKAKEVITLEGKVDLENLKNKQNKIISGDPTLGKINVTETIETGTSTAKQIQLENPPIVKISVAPTNPLHTSCTVAATTSWQQPVSLAMTIQTTKEITHHTWCNNRSGSLVANKVESSTSSSSWVGSNPEQQTQTLLINHEAGQVWLEQTIKPSKLSCVTQQNVHYSQASSNSQGTQFISDKPGNKDLSENTPVVQLPKASVTDNPVQQKTNAASQASWQSVRGTQEQGNITTCTSIVDDRSIKESKANTSSTVVSTPLISSGIEERQINAPKNISTNWSSVSKQQSIKKLNTTWQEECISSNAKVACQSNTIIAKPEQAKSTANNWPITEKQDTVKDSVSNWTGKSKPEEIKGGSATWTGPNKQENSRTEPLWMGQNKSADGKNVINSWANANKSDNEKLSGANWNNQNNSEEAKMKMPVWRGQSKPDTGKVKDLPWVAQNKSDSEKTNTTSWTNQNKPESAKRNEWSNQKKPESIKTNPPLWIDQNKSNMNINTWVGQSKQDGGKVNSDWSVHAKVDEVVNANCFVQNWSEQQVLKDDNKKVSSTINKTQEISWQPLQSVQYDNTYTNFFNHQSLDFQKPCDNFNFTPAKPFAVEDTNPKNKPDFPKNNIFQFEDKSCQKTNKTYTQETVKSFPLEEQRNSRPPVNWMTGPDIRSTGLQNNPSFGVHNLNMKCTQEPKTYAENFMDMQNIQTAKNYPNNTMQHQNKNNCYKSKDSNYNIFDYNYSTNNQMENVHFFELDKTQFCPNTPKKTRMKKKAESTNTNFVDDGKKKEHNIETHLEFTHLPNQECWTPMKTMEWSSNKFNMDNNFIVPSTLPTLVGDLALGTHTNASDNVKTADKHCNDSNKEMETNKNIEPFTNLSRNIFDVTNKNVETFTGTTKNFSENDTIVIKNIFDLPPVTKSDNFVKERAYPSQVNRSQKGRVNHPQNNFFSVSQLVETQNNYDLLKTDMDNHRCNPETNFTYPTKQYRSKGRNNYKNERKYPNYKNNISNYSAEVLMKSSNSNFQTEGREPFFENKKIDNYQEKDATKPEYTQLNSATQNIYTDFNYSSPVPNFNISTNISSCNINSEFFNQHENTFVHQNNFLSDLVPEYPLTDSVQNSLLLPCTALQNPFLNNEKHPEKKKNLKKKFEGVKSQVQTDFSLSSTQINCPPIFTNTSTTQFPNNKKLPSFYTTPTFTSSFSTLSTISNVNTQKSTFNSANFLPSVPLSQPPTFTSSNISFPVSNAIVSFPSTSQSVPFLSLSNPSISAPVLPPSSSNSLANFNLSTIFPEMNQKGNFQYP